MKYIDAMASKGLASLFLGMLLFSPAQILAEEATQAHVYKNVEYLKQDLEFIRQEIGMPKPGKNIFNITGASPTEVLYQAMTLCEKAGQLRLEWTRTLGHCPVAPMGRITLLDVMTYVNRSNEHLGVVKKYFKVEESPVGSLFNADKNLADVFMDIVTANRQLNILLRKRYLPDDVFREVTLAIYYTAELLGRFPYLKQRIPSAPELVRKKSPKDVYRLLLDGYSLVRQLSQLSGEEALYLELNKAQLIQVEPADVYDVAALIVSKLAFLYWRAGGTKDIKAYQPPPKIPSQVYQRSSILMLQLQMLLEHVSVHPDWLEGNS